MVNYNLSFEGLTSAEQNAVTQLKQRMVGCMRPEMFSDLSVFVRFLRARDLNVNAAEAMLRNHLDWRKINQVDTILTNYTPKELLKRYVTLNSMGIDKEGAPIIYFHLGNIDTRGLLKSCRRTDIIKYIIFLLEQNVVILKKQSALLGKTIDKWTMILNFENFSFAVATHKQTLDLVGNLITMYEANYPERLKLAFFINASVYFTIAFSVVKHFISEITYKKIKFYGTDGWLDDLLNMIDEDTLPAFLGGKRTDPDGNPLCKTIITHGGFVDESYFFKKKENSIANLPGVSKLTVTRMSKTQLTLKVTEAGSCIEWEFETKSRDIAFALLYKKNEYDKVQALIPKQRIDTYMSAEIGMMKCEVPGLYLIEFDNSYSWIFKKEIYYRVSVVKH